MSTLPRKSSCNGGMPRQTSLKSSILAQSLGIRLASHDDATQAHVDEAVADGVAIAEFPTTAASAEAAHARGLAVLMGAPNIVRGGSHSGNISACDMANAASGHSVVRLCAREPSSCGLCAAGNVEAITLPQAIGFVSARPAAAVGLEDRGEIALGKRADLVQVNVSSGRPVVRRVWREGIRVL